MKKKSFSMHCFKVFLKRGKQYLTIKISWACVILFKYIILKNKVILWLKKIIKTHFSSTCSLSQHAVNKAISISGPCVPRDHKSCIKLFLWWSSAHFSSIHFWKSGLYFGNLRIFYSFVINIVIIILEICVLWV